MMKTRMPYVAEMTLLREDILAMSSLVGENLGKAVQALSAGDQELAARVKTADGSVDDMQALIQDRAAVLIATQQPVAGDLRELVAIIRLADNLERMGDYVAHLAKTALKLKEARWPRHFSILAEMGSLGMAMIRSMAAAFISRDAEAARACASLDGRMDELHHSLLDLTIEGIKADPRDADDAMKIIRTSGFLERLGDRVTNGCELAVYVVNGGHAELN